MVNGHSDVPIKAGWLLKKRDIIFGWQCRYFVVYVGRVEYYIDQHDQQPRGVYVGAQMRTHNIESVTLNYLYRLQFFLAETLSLSLHTYTGVIQLFGAEIRTATKCSVNGVHDHWAISIEPRNKERAFKLASELTGEEGMVDATSWVQVFMIAARPAESSFGLHGIYLFIYTLSCNRHKTHRLYECTPR